MTPPGKEEAAPFDAARSGERQQPNPQIELCKAWLRASPQARRELLQDVKFAHPQLWREVAEGTDP